VVPTLGQRTRKNGAATVGMRRASKDKVWVGTRLDPTVGSGTMLSLGIALENQLDGGFYVRLEP